LVAFVNERPAGFHFSTDDLPTKDRLPVWREVFGRMIGRMDFEVAGDRPLRQTVDVRAFEGLCLTINETNGIIARRTRELLADGGDDFAFTASLSGPFLASWAGRTIELEPGEAVLMSTAEVSTIHFPTAARFVGLRVPRRTLGALVDEPESILLRRVRKDTEALRLIRAYVAATSDQDFAGPRVQQLFASHLHDLVALAVGPSRDATEIARHRGLQAGRLQAIKTGILAHLGQRDLSVARVAKTQAVTPRYVQMLFEAEGTTFSRFVLGERLAWARRLLADPRAVGRPIIGIALEAGFGDLSYFNRAFRRRYGMTPSDMKASALRPYDH
jgi:AraC-like DNA-binding protein